MRINKFFSVFLVLFALVGLVSCSTVKNSLYRLGFRSYKTKAVEDLEKNTKSYTLYRDFSTIAKIKVTHFNKQLYEEYLKGIVGVNPSIAKYKPYVDAFDKHNIYYIAFYTPDLSINNLEDKNSFWNVYLSACGKIYRPESIDFTDKNDWRASWLYNVGGDRWYREYIVKFEKNNCKEETFVISSFLGTAALKFNESVLKR